MAGPILSVVRMVAWKDKKEKHTLTSGSDGVDYLIERSPSTIIRRRPGEDG